MVELVGNQADGVSQLYLLRVLNCLLNMVQAPGGVRRHQKLSKKLHDWECLNIQAESKLEEGSLCWHHTLSMEGALIAFKYNLASSVVFSF